MAFDTPELPSGNFVTLGLAAAASIVAGQLVARNAAGNAVKADDAAGLVVIGRAEADADNTGGGAGDVSVLIKRGTFRFDNSVANAIAADDIGKIAFVEDDENTVAATGGTNNIPAGIIRRVDADGVWVDTSFNGHRTAVVLTSTNGTAAAASANLANLAAETEKVGDDVRAIHAALVAKGILSAA